MAEMGCAYCDPKLKAEMRGWVDQLLNERRPDRYRVSDPLTRDFEPPTEGDVQDDSWLADVAEEVAKRYPPCERCLEVGRRTMIRSRFEQN